MFRYLIVLLTLCVFVIPVHALDISIAPTHSIDYSDSSLSSTTGIELGVGHKHLFARLSFNDDLLRMGGQGAQGIKLYGAAVGLRKDVGRVEGFASIGYYHPSTSPRATFDEAALYAFSNALGISIGDPTYRKWKNYGYKLSPGIGVTFGGQYLHPVGKHLVIGLGMSYRLLNLSEEIYGYDGVLEPEKNLHWEVFKERKLNEMYVSIIIRYIF